MWQQVNSALSESAHRVLFNLASFLPGLVALLVAVLLLTLIGSGLAALLRRVLVAVKFDERLSRNQAAAAISNIQEWSPAHSPTVLVTRVVFWGCVLLGVIVGISAFNASYSDNSNISVFILPYLTHSVGAVILLLIGNLIARFLSRSVLIGAVNARLQYARFLSLGVKWLVLVLTAAMVLDHLQIGGTVVDLAFGILFGGIVLTLSLAIGLGSRDLVSRSIEKSTTDGPVTYDPPPSPEAPRPPTPIDTLRHF
ncbi:hypothetical protein [Granulicella sp. dw_53]|uniref:hypothetical protein n=1 Tax=Granulicella sp. dw_53 TaxID=2719792 RepID=UPI001BD5E104|nr:hypothetical protein [Granulicella sp. dw_53]